MLEIERSRPILDIIKDRIGEVVADGQGDRMSFNQAGREEKILFPKDVRSAAPNRLPPP